MGEAMGAGTGVQAGDEVELGGSKTYLENKNIEYLVAEWLSEVKDRKELG